MATGSTKFKNSLNLEPVSADPSSPAEGDIQFSDGTARAKGLWIYKDGAWVEAGSSGSGGINYLEGDNSDFENGVGDWVAYADAAATTPADGTGGTPTTTIAQSTDTSLRGAANGLITKAAANDQGEGASCAFTIDEADQAKKLTISFDYTTSANYADDDIKVFVYDVTNSNLIRVNGEDLKAVSGQSTHYAQFQTAPDSTSYRLILHVSSTNATAYTVRIDNVKVGPTSLAKGAITTDWESYTPSNTQGFGTISSNSLEWRRVGSNIEIRGGFTAGTVTADTAQLELPSGLTLAGGARYYVGEIVRAGTAQPYRLMAVSGRTYLTIGAGASQHGDVAGNTFIGSSETLYLEGTAPIAGWSSEAVMSEDLGGREIAVEAIGSGAGQSITANTTDIDFVESIDTTSSYDGTTFTVPETGRYKFSGVVRVATTSATAISIYKDGSFYVLSGYSSGGTAIPINSELALEKGDAITFRADQTTTVVSTSDSHVLSISKISSPQTVLETETVAARYTSDAGQTIASAGTALMEDLDYDTHNAYNTSTGEYTVPSSGYYKIVFSGRPSTATTLIFGLYVNGADKAYAGNDDGSTANFATITDVLKLSKGDVLTVRNISGAGRTLNTSAFSNYFSITRVK